MPSFQSIEKRSIPNPNKIVYNYAPRSNGGLALDISTGGGRDALYLASIGYSVTAFDLQPDLSERCNDLAKKHRLDVQCSSEKLEGLRLTGKKFDFITCTWVLHSLKKSRSDQLIRELTGALNPGGMLVLAVFSVNDPYFKRIEQSVNFIEENTFYSPEHRGFVHYFSKDEILGLTSELRLMMISEKLSLDAGHGLPHYHGLLEYVGLKNEPVNLY